MNATFYNYVDISFQEFSISHALKIHFAAFNFMGSYWQYTQIFQIVNYLINKQKERKTESYMDLLRVKDWNDICHKMAW